MVEKHFCNSLIWDCILKPDLGIPFLGGEWGFELLAENYNQIIMYR